MLRPPEATVRIACEVVPRHFGHRNSKAYLIRGHSRKVGAAFEPCCRRSRASAAARLLRCNSWALPALSRCSPQ